MELKTRRVVHVHTTVLDCELLNLFLLSLLLKDGYVRRTKVGAVNLKNIG
jgi:hypothetical protein